LDFPSPKSIGIWNASNGFFQSIIYLPNLKVNS
jgi:hypothetical protein